MHVLDSWDRPISGPPPMQEYSSRVVFVPIWVSHCIRTQVTIKTLRLPIARHRPGYIPTTSHHITPLYSTRSTQPDDASTDSDGHNRPTQLDLTNLVTHRRKRETLISRPSPNHRLNWDLTWTSFRLTFSSHSWSHSYSNHLRSTFQSVPLRFRLADSIPLNWIIRHELVLWTRQEAEISSQSNKQISISGTIARTMTMAASVWG